MSTHKPAPPRPPTSDDVEPYLQDLQLTCMAEHSRDFAQQAAHQPWAHLDYLGQLVEGEARLRQDRAMQRRIRLARFPVMKTLDQFRGDWPTQINRELIQPPFTLSFLQAHMTLFYLGGVGLGKTHVAVALG
jgi:DNA replication protein DnaC